MLKKWNMRDGYQVRKNIEWDQKPQAAQDRSTEHCNPGRGR